MDSTALGKRADSEAQLLFQLFYVPNSEQSYRGKIDSIRYEAFVFLAENDFACGSYESSLSHSVDALGVDTLRPEAFLLAARSSFLLGRCEEAVKYLHRTASSTTNSETLRLVAQMLAGYSEQCH